MKSNNSIKILAIGNSFSDNAMNYLYPILNALGYDEIVLGNLYIGGCTLIVHAHNAKHNLSAYTYRKNTTGKFVNTEQTAIATAIADEDWQFVTMQQASGVSGVESTYNNDLQTLKNYVSTLVDTNKCKLAWHMTWAYQQDSNHPEFANYGKSQPHMYKSIVNCVQNSIVNDGNFDTIIPAGTAIQNARTSYLGDTLTVDGYHLDGLGEFIAGLTWAVTLTQRSLDKLDVTKLPQQFAPYLDVAIEAVNNAVSHPFEITQSQHTTDPDSEIQLNTITTLSNVQYSDISDKCKLDIYLPNGVTGFDSIVHFHGGGFSSGSKDDYAHVAMAKGIASRGVAFVSANYRMFPTAKYGDFYADGANAIKYVFDNVKKLGGNGKIYVSGQSAGANMAMMLAFNRQYLAKVNLKTTDIAGWIIESGQPTTHFEVLIQAGLDPNAQIVDERAPMYYVNGETCFNKMLLIAYTDDITNRLNQNKLLYQTILGFNPNALVELRTLYGQHCVSSTTPYRNKYVYPDILLDFVNSEK